MRVHGRQRRLPGAAPRPDRRGPVPGARLDRRSLGAVLCAFLLGPWARDRDDWIQYEIAGGLLALGVLLWAITWLTNRGIRAKKTGFRDIEHLE